MRFRVSEAVASDDLLESSISNRFPRQGQTFTVHPCTTKLLFDGVCHASTAP